MNIEAETMKSSSLHKQQEYEISVDESTVGIDIESLDLSSPASITQILSDEEAEYSSSNLKELKYVVWDFAGQIEYSTLHPVSILFICSNHYFPHSKDLFRNLLSLFITTNYI